MKHKEVLELKEKLTKVKGLSGAKLNYCIKENLQKIKEVSAPLIEMEEEIISTIKSYEEEMKAIQEKFAEVDGEPKYKQVGDDTFYDIPESKIPELNKALSELIVKHKENLDLYTTKIKEYSTFVETAESSFICSQIDFKYIPEDISTEDMELIFNLIKPEVHEPA